MTGSPGSAPVELCVLLWAHAGRGAELADYEDDVLRLLGTHGATLVSRVRTTQASDGAPTEVHVIRFATQDGFGAYMADPARAAMSERRDFAIARTEIHPVAVIAP